MSLCDCSQPQCYGLRGHRKCLCGLTPSGYPQHIRPLDTHPLTRGTTNAGYVRRRYAKKDCMLASASCSSFSVTECNKTVIIYYCVLFSCSVIGALIGKQEGRNIEVMNSFELLSHTIDDRVHIDKEYYYTKEEQCKWSLCRKDNNAALFMFSLL